MKKLTAIVTLACLFALSDARSQQSSLKGTIRDTLNKQNLANAVITVLRQKDSVMVRYARTDEQGNFSLTKLPAGNFIVLVSYPSYADYVDRITLEPGVDKQLGMLPVITKANLLQAVIVKGTVTGIKVKGDTTEFKADSFHINPNDDASELLKKMPGMQVNSKGEITFQGEKVQKVYVDGEEFFSDDPAVVTKNLRGDMIDKVQAYDKKSDQATFTGIDDGVKNKTINLVLKEDKKKGYFGKVEAGTDFDKYRYGKGLLNAFKGKRKISGYITADNTKPETLSWDENRNYGGDANSGVTVGDDGGVYITSTGNDFSSGRGLPDSYTGGFHFSNKWDKDKHNSNNTYQFNQLNLTTDVNSWTKNILPDTTFTNTTRQIQNNDRTRHRLTSFYEWQIDSSSSLKLTVRGSNMKTNGSSNYLGQSISEDNRIINSTDRTTTTNDDNSTLNNNLLWRKKFAKKGRTISNTTDFNFSDRKQSGLLLAHNVFFDAAGNMVRVDNVDQLKTEKQTTSTISNLLTYTEPLWKNTFLVLNYKLDLNWNNIDRTTFNKDGSGKYQAVVDTLSNHFLYNTTAHLGSATIRYNYKKVNFSFGAGGGQSIYHLTDVRKSTEREVRFNNFIPTAAFTYMPKQQRRISFNYSGTTRNPTLAQIQPIIDNTDPLNITIGNPNLKQSFVHNFSLNASDYKVLKSRNIYIFANSSVTENAITNASTIDSLGRRVNQAINVNGNYYIYTNIGYGLNVAKGLNMSLGAGPNWSRNVNVINGLRNETSASGIGLNLYSNYNSDKWLNFYGGVSANYNRSSSSIRPDVVTQYWQYGINANPQLKFKKQKLFIDLTFNGTIYQKTAEFANQPDMFIFSPSIRKVISKNDNWEVKAFMNDVFNQNQGLTRNINSNYISSTTTQIVQRYFLFSLIYNFSKNGKPSNMGF